MPHYARIQDAKVKEVRQFDSIEGRFHESLTWVECPQSTEEGWTYDTNTGEFAEPPKSDPTLSEAQSERIAEIKEQANAVLKETDWYVIRKQETGEAIPQDVLDHRSTVRSKSGTFEQEVNDLGTVEDVLNYTFTFPDPPKNTDAE